MLYNDSFIDLPGVHLPFSYSDIFTDLDYEIMETRTAPLGGAQSTHIAWGVNASETQKRYRDVSLIGFIFSKDLQYAMREHFEKTYNYSILDSLQPVFPGKKIMPVTLITFSGNTPWHREGFSQEWSTRGFEKQYHRFSPRSRYNFAVNYPFYVKDADTTKVEFAKTSKAIQDIDQQLMLKLISNESDHEEQSGIRVSRSLDQIVDDSMWQNDITVTNTKYGYDCPYIINLSSYHRVTTTNATRLSLRYMASTSYQWADIEHMYNTGTLLKNA